MIEQRFRVPESRGEFVASVLFDLVLAFCVGVAGPLILAGVGNLL